MPSGQDHKQLENRLLVFWTFKRYGTQDRLGKWSEKLEKLNTGWCCSWLGQEALSGANMSGKVKKIDRSHTAEFLLYFSSLYKQITLSLMIKYPKRIFSWISLQNSCCFQTVGLIWVWLHLWERAFWKTKLVVFSIILSFLKSNAELEKKEVDPCNTTHTLDTIVKNGILFNRI